jgi:hypothetical protein
MPVPRSQIGRPVGLAGHIHDPAHALGDQVKAAAPGILSGSKRRFPSLAFGAPSARSFELSLLTRH